MKNEYYNGANERKVKFRYSVNSLNGKKCGDFLWLAENGDTIEVSMYRSGQLDGVSYQFFPNGQVQLAMQYEQGMRQGVTRHFYQNGQLKIECEFNNNRLWAVHAHYDSMGHALDFGYLVNGNGTITFYYPDGSLNYRGKFKEGFRHGEWVFFSDTGVIIDSIEYVDGYGPYSTEQEYMY